MTFDIASLTCSTVASVRYVFAEFLSHVMEAQPDWLLDHRHIGVEGEAECAVAGLLQVWR
jgi:hypothetical protein